MARIVRALANSKYLIHDLSRCTGEGIENVARFNMPLELGMAMARRLLETSSRLLADRVWRRALNELADRAHQLIDPGI